MILDLRAGGVSYQLGGVYKGMSGMPASDKHLIATGGSPEPGPANGQEVTRLRDLSPQQWKSGIAAWLGWLFDGLDMHLYTLVATPFVAELLTWRRPDDSGRAIYGSLIQAAFLVGWALGGGFFGRIGDRLGRARALNLTILTYAMFTGLSFFAQTWWHLLICRFLAALGDRRRVGGGGVAVVGDLAATLAAVDRRRAAERGQRRRAAGDGGGRCCWSSRLSRIRCVFLVGILPALLVVWIRRAVPETGGVARGQGRRPSRTSPASPTCSAARCGGPRC